MSLLQQTGGGPLRVRVVPRTFRFKQPAGTSRGVYHERCVWYVVITSPGRPDYVGVGECAPLFDLSCDYTPDYEQTLREFCAVFERTGCIDYERMRPFPSMLFGMETAVLSFLGSCKGDFLHLYDTPFTRGETGIPINGLVWMGSYEEMLQRMEQKLAAGYRCVKLKIGAIRFDEELELVRKLRSRYSREDVELRVDANGAFSPEDALCRLEQLARYDIHSIEQPIRAGQWEEMAALCRKTPLPIALDEELIGVNTLCRKQVMLDEIRPQYIILKPSLHGGLAGSEEWIAMAAARNIPYWVTSALESNVGLNAIAQWTSRLQASSAAQGPASPAVHGLGTGQLFVDNFHGTHLTIEGDRLYVTGKTQRNFRNAVQEFEKAWRNGEKTMTVKTSGSTGTPKEILAEKRYMAASAAMTCDFLGLKSGDTALLCMPLQYIAGKMLAVRAFTRGLKLIAVAPSSHPFAALHRAPVFAAMTPQQVCETLRVPREAAMLRNVRQLIIGGGAVSPELAARLKRFTNGQVWSTYGMTETLSHVALRRLNGPEAAEYYRPLPGVNLSLSPEGCLVIDAPVIGVRGLATNDLAVIHSDGTFEITGRRDNVICSGGLKMHIEDLESRLSALPVPYLVTAVPDAVYGETVTLLYEGVPELAEELQAICRERLARYEVPKHYWAVNALPKTPTGKPARAEAKQLAARCLLPTQDS